MGLKTKGEWGKTKGVVAGIQKSSFMAELGLRGTLQCKEQPVQICSVTIHKHRECVKHQNPAKILEQHLQGRNWHLVEVRESWGPGPRGHFTSLCSCPSLLLDLFSAGPSAFLTFFCFPRLFLPHPSHPSFYCDVHWPDSSSPLSRHILLASPPLPLGIFVFILLQYSWFTMLCSFLYRKWFSYTYIPVYIYIYIYTHTHIFHIFSLWFIIGY